MTLTYPRLLAGTALATTLAVVAACSGTSPSMSPTAPTSSASSASAGANFSPNPNACTLPANWITDPSDQDGCVCPAPNVVDNTVDPPTCLPPPPPTGKLCSPGYWKTHETEFLAACGSVPGWTCKDLAIAIDPQACKALLGKNASDEACRRNEAGDALSIAASCFED